MLLTMWGDKCQLNLGWWSFCNTHIYHIVMLYNFNLRNVICQLYLDKNRGGGQKC